MKTKLLSLAGLVAALTLTGCASLPTAEEATIHRNVDRPAKVLNAAIRKAADERGFHERAENVFERAEVPPYGFFRFRLALSPTPQGTSVTAVAQIVGKNSADQDTSVYYVRPDSGYYRQIVSLLDSAVAEASFAKTP